MTDLQSGFEPGTLQLGHLTTRPSRPCTFMHSIFELFGNICYIESHARSFTNKRELKATKVSTEVIQSVLPMYGILKMIIRDKNLLFSMQKFPVVIFINIIDNIETQLPQTFFDVDLRLSIVV
ncbi:hypothetical protein AVEN_72460-1 [Araneus ventricosus]|uniref:Uncharacterized protein n=1 Tax=Araneus ventricosus TaxID=182803 RepID=A0A4Y2HPZ6_ARAVE|nr:hypothetical protein AVEN_72460-1 [Araneus ventricosus]